MSNLRNKLTLLFTGILVLTLSCKKNGQFVADGVIQKSLLDSVNNLRSSGCKCGNDSMSPVAPLVWNDFLAKAAELLAKDMYSRNYFEHLSPEGTFPVQRAQAVGYTGTTVGEIIAKGYKDAGGAMSGWKASESHCKAMMEPFYLETGAYSYNGFWVQEFGK